MTSNDNTTITIDRPAGQIRDRVSVLNYRCKPERWETAEIRRLYYIPDYVYTAVDDDMYKIPGYWVYEVWIERPRVWDKYGRERGGGYSIEVSGIRVMVAGGEESV